MGLGFNYMFCKQLTDLVGKCNNKRVNKVYTTGCSTGSVNLGGFGTQLTFLLGIDRIFILYIENNEKAWRVQSL